MLRRIRRGSRQNSVDRLDGTRLTTGALWAIWRRRCHSVNQVLRPNREHPSERIVAMETVEETDSRRKVSWTRFLASLTPCVRRCARSDAASRCGWGEFSLLVDLLSSIAVLSRLQARAGLAHFVHAPRICRRTICLIAGMLSWPLPKSLAFYSSFEPKNGWNNAALAMVLRLDLTRVEIRAAISMAICASSKASPPRGACTSVASAWKTAHSHSFNHGLLPKETAA